MTIHVTGANGQLGNEMRIVTKNSKEKYIFTVVYDEHSESLEMQHKLAGEDVTYRVCSLKAESLLYETI